MDQAAILRLLRERTERSSQAKVARELKVSQQYLCDVLAQRRPLGPKILKALGISRKLVYETTKGE